MCIAENIHNARKLIKINVVKNTKEGVNLLTYEEAKEELCEYRDNIRYIEEKQNDALELRTRLESTTRALSNIPFGKGQKEKLQLEEYIDRMREIEKDCNKKLQELLLKKFAVEEKIDKLEQPYKTVLYLRFIRGIKLKDMKNGYTERQCLRIQKRRNKFIRKFINMSVKGIECQ